MNIGIIGLGFMGSTHFRIYDKHPLANIRAVADVDDAKLKGDWSSIVGNIGEADNSVPVDMTGISTYSDAMDLIRDPEVQLVDICVPTYLHKQYIIAALEAGKHVLSEKPLARNTEEAREIVEAAKKSKGHLMVGMCIRFWPEYQHAYQLVRSGKIGAVKAATFKRVSPSIAGTSWEDWFMQADKSGSALLDLHLHDTDAVHYFFGKPERVTSFGLKGFRSDHGVDHVVTRYDFGDQRLITAEGGWSPAGATPFEMSFLIVGEKATIRLSETGYKVIYEDGQVEEPAPANPDLPTGWHVEIDYLLRTLLDGQAPDSYMTIEEIAGSLAIIEAEQRSVDEGRTVRVSYQ